MNVGAGPGREPGLAPFQSQSADCIADLTDSSNRTSISLGESLAPLFSFVSSRRSRFVWLRTFIWAIASAERLPCRQACRLLLGAPLLVPPCIRQR